MALADVRLTIHDRPVRINEADIPQLAHQGLVADVTLVPDTPRRTDTETTGADVPGEPEGNRQ